jgi:hypothetical protein
LRDKPTALRTLVEIRRRIAALGPICSGVLLERMKVCGKPGCRCAEDPALRHGPYYQWGHRESGVLRQRNVTAEEAHALRAAMDNYQRLLELLANWEQRSVEDILGRDRVPRKTRSRQIRPKRS